MIRQSLYDRRESPITTLQHTVIELGNYGKLQVVRPIYPAIFAVAIPILHTVTQLNFSSTLNTIMLFFHIHHHISEYITVQDKQYTM